MADDTIPPSPANRAAARKPGPKAGTAAATLASSPAIPSSNAVAKAPTMTEPTTNLHRAEAKTRFTAAIDEAKAGAAALRAEATERAGVYRNQAEAKTKDLAGEARAYSAEAKVKGKELAAQGKGKVSEGLTALGQAVGDSAHVVDEKLGAKYGDYARSASRNLTDAANRLDTKSVEELGEDAREFVRKSPGTAVGIAAVVGFLLSRLFRR